MTSGFFALFDDIASLLDDVASMSKIAGKKTAGILGDDLAVNTEKATGFASKRELPVLWAIAKGSFLNKLMILPVMFLLSYFLPQIVTPILLIGGTYLSFEAAEKIFDYFFHKKEESNSEAPTSLKKSDILAYEKKKIKSAILVDFILSIEIVIIALSTVIDEPLKVQIIVVSVISILATVGVYSIVALIVRMDDVGYKLIKIGKTPISRTLGKILVNSLPFILKTLTIVGTLAMLLVAGGIFIHNIHFLHDYLPSFPDIINELLTGFLIGTIVLMIVKGITFVVKKIKS